MIRRLHVDLGDGGVVRVALGTDAELAECKRIAEAEERAVQADRGFWPTADHCGTRLGSQRWRAEEGLGR